LECLFIEGFGLLFAERAKGATAFAAALDVLCIVYIGGGDTCVSGDREIAEKKLILKKAQAMARGYMGAVAAMVSVTAL
jgi:hypothetical protein